MAVVLYGGLQQIVAVEVSAAAVAAAATAVVAAEHPTPSTLKRMVGPSVEHRVNRQYRQ